MELFRMRRSIRKKIKIVKRKCEERKNCKVTKITMKKKKKLKTSSMKKMKKSKSNLRTPRNLKNPDLYNDSKDKTPPLDTRESARKKMKAVSRESNDVKKCQRTKKGNERKDSQCAADESNNNGSDEESVQHPEEDGNNFF